MSSWPGSCSTRSSKLGTAASRLRCRSSTCHSSAMRIGVVRQEVKTSAGQVGLLGSVSLLPHDAKSTDMLASVAVLGSGWPDDLVDSSSAL